MSNDTYNPGSKDGHSGFCDSNNNVYVFCGRGFRGGSYKPNYIFLPFSTAETYDLWKWNGTWTWLLGGSYENASGPIVASYGENPANQIGSRKQFSVIYQNDEKIWVFGGEGRSELYPFPVALNELWSLNLTSMYWNFHGNKTANYGLLRMESLSNSPPPRYSYTAWSMEPSDEYFWIFGGMSGDTSPQYYNDLWRFNTATTKW